jgi:tRNA A-37 threonylcarbamoyl transferase component Bud32
MGDSGQNSIQTTEAEGKTSLSHAQEDAVEISYKSGFLAVVIVLHLFLLGTLFYLFVCLDVPRWDVFLGFAGGITVFLLPVFFAANITYKVKVSAEGISFSRGFRFMAGRFSRPWDDLHAVQLASAGGNDAAIGNVRWRGKFFDIRNQRKGWARLNFDFKSGGSASIDLPYLSRNQGEQLLRALDKWGDTAKFSAPVVNLERSLLLETDTIASPTTIWQDDLTAQYVATNYVPLPSNHSLQEGRIRVLMELAAGGMSAVYLAEDKSRGKVVLKEAVTPIDVSEQQRDKARQLFAREAKLLEKLNHDQIARVLDHFVERGRDYLVLEYIVGVTLRQTVKGGGPQKESTVLTWARQILHILEYLHSQSPPIIHRDLTPDNLILGRDGKIVLVDFGAANEFVGSATGTMIGKQCYIAPEQLRGKANPQSDLYAFGGCLFYLLTGQDPTPLSVSNPTKWAPKTSIALARLASDCTAFEAQDRPQSAAVAMARLNSIGRD